MMRILVYGQRFKDADQKYVEELFQALIGNGFVVRIYAPYLEQVRQAIPIPGTFGSFQHASDFEKEPIDIVITLGGDGTILSAVTLIKDHRIPIMGINLGRLGFLAAIEKKIISQAIGELAAGNYRIEDRTMLYLETDDESLFGDARFALNDFTLHKRDTSSMITIHTFVDGHFLNSYWADGVILSTPTGSTGYSLSCGGPIIHPGSGNFVITPVAPHNLTVRPIVISDNHVVSFKMEGRTENSLATLDSRFEPVTANQRLDLRKCAFPARLVLLESFSFLRTIREKLAWGKDMRNSYVE